MADRLAAGPNAGASPPHQAQPAARPPPVATVVRSQVQMCMLLGCMLLLLLSLIALSWRKWGAVIMRAQHDPKWEAREPSPNSSPTMRASKKQK